MALKPEVKRLRPNKVLLYYTLLTPLLHVRDRTVIGDPTTASRSHEWMYVDLQTGRAAPSTWHD